MSPDPTTSQNTVPTEGPPRDRQGARVAFGCGQRTNMIDPLKRPGDGGADTIADKD
jgi:hypothetical protein